MNKKNIFCKDEGLKELLKTIFYGGLTMAGMYAAYQLGLNLGVAKTYVTMVDWNPNQAREFYEFVLIQLENK